MSLNEVIKTQLYLFFPITGVTFIITMICAAVLGYDAILLSELFLLMIFIVVCTLGFTIFYSKKELTKRELITRYTVHLLIVLISATILMLYAGWISLELSYLAITLPLQTLGYAAVVVIDNVHSRRLAGKFNKALEQFCDSHQADI